MPVSKDNAMRICIPRPVTGWILLPLLVSCSSVDATKATRMSAFRPDGSTPTKLSESELANIEEYGVVVEFRKGDEIEVRFVTSGTLAELTEPPGPRVDLHPCCYDYGEFDITVRSISPPVPDSR